MSSDDIPVILRQAWGFVLSCWPLVLILLGISAAFEFSDAQIQAGEVPDTYLLTLGYICLSAAVDMLATVWCVRRFHGHDLRHSALPDRYTFQKFALPALFIAAPYIFAGSMSLIAFLDDTSFSTAEIIAIVIGALLLIAAMIVWFVANYALTPWIVTRANGEAMSAHESRELMDGQKFNMFIGTFIFGLMFGIPGAMARYLLDPLVAVPITAILGVGSAICFAAIRYRYYAFVTGREADLTEGDGQSLPT